MSDAGSRGRPLRGGGLAASVLMLASGFAGLGLEMVWTQESALLAGQEVAAVLAVVAAFFGGLAVGASALGPRLALSSAAHALGWYAGCELLVALWTVMRSLFGATLLGRASVFLGPTPSPAAHGALVFAATFVSLLPATAAMGATLPAMDRLMVALRGAPAGHASTVATLYAANTAGAVLGVLGSTFLLLPTFGLRHTSWICAALAGLCGAGSLRLFRALSPGGGARAAVEERAAVGGPGPVSSRAALAPLALGGFLGIGYEVVVVRVLGQLNESTVYTFAVLLAIYLVGTALGAAAFARWGAARANDAASSPAPWVERLPFVLAGLCLLGVGVLQLAPSVHRAARAVFGGDGVSVSLAAEAMPALLAFLPPTVAMGALFAELARRAEAGGVSLGRALAANTFGASLAPVMFGAVLGPWLGPKGTLVLVACGYLLLVPVGTWLRPGRERALALALGLGAVLVAAGTPPLAHVSLPPGGRVLSYEEGVAAAVSVVEDADGVVTLRINDRAQEGSNVTLRVDARQAWQPLLLHPRPQRALFLGLGTGITARAAAAEPSLQVDVVELLPEVVRASAHFPREPLGEVSSRAGGGAPRVLVGDARRFVRATPERYDVIVSDNFHPARSGAGSLYTVEHFRAVRARLAAGGLFCQWLPLHQMDLPTLASIVRSFLVSFPDGAALLASNSLETPVIGLLGGAGTVGLQFDPAVIGARLARAPAAVSSLGFEDELAVLGGFVAGPRALARWAEGAPLNTDDHPVVVYLAPRATYAKLGPPRDRLMAFLQRVGIEAEELLVPGARAGWSARLASYGRARLRFLEAGLAVRPSADVVAMLAQVEGPLLGALHESPDFRPAFDPLVAMARALVPRDRTHAHALLEELTRLQPARLDDADVSTVRPERP